MRHLTLLTAAELLSPAFWSVALCALRLAPVTYLCPLFGGLGLPPSVRLGLVLSLSGALYAGGVRSALGLTSLPAITSAAARELAVGLTIGWVASLPFEALRMGGRFIDLFRGASAEAALPYAGATDAASAEGLHRLVVAMASAGIALPEVVAALWRSFRLVPLGTFVLHSSAIDALPALALGAVSTGLAVSAPVLAVTLGLEGLLALASRAAPGFPVSEASAPLRGLGGGAILGLGLGLMGDRLQTEWATALASLEALLRVGGS